ncbi:thiosulfate sulfurtransferase PspE precursor [mine drainage metagenome]|uniref:Thiosulfate sulfurtransferase PspE n=1 Tax=mine drainage metagenome TaxID=410659 RepID=A0A1J5RQY8_9ZZZZ
MSFSRFLIHAATVVTLLLAPTLASADENNEAIKAMEEYLTFVDYGGGTISAEQIPKDDWKRFYVIDARDKEQFDKEHIPGAVNLEWRQVLEKRASIPKDKPVLIYCNTGSLSAQAGFALRVVGYENVRIIQGGFADWKTKGGFDATEKAARARGEVK